MNTVVIDTNVLLVANQQHPDVSEECVFACTKELIDARNNVVVIDDGYRILNEYMHKATPSENRSGDSFLKWLLQNNANPERVHQVPITESPPEMFVEFPDQTLQPEFDAPDRKFPTVANVHPCKPPILQAADCKWLDWQSALHAKGINIKFICPNDVRRFYQGKFPNKPVPDSA